MKMANFLSPLTKTGKVSLVKNINKKEIIKSYHSFNIDVSKYFKNIDIVSIYKCEDTGYKFYFPFNLSGDSLFYEHLQKFEWYYMPWKWEHESSRNYIKSGDKILEIGCARGAFLKRINELQDLSLSIGLELNQSTTDNNGKYNIINETIQSFKNGNKDQFDVVCSFQVLEHIAKPHSFISSSIDCLKKGGALLISVPNNNSFINNLDSCLNMPPHHVGLWNESSLRNLSEIFPLKIIDTHFEPLQEYHIGDYLNSKYYSHYPPMLRKVIRKLHKISGIYNKRYLNTRSNLSNITGETILIVFEKL